MEEYFIWVSKAKCDMPKCEGRFRWGGERRYKKTLVRQVYLTEAEFRIIRRKKTKKQSR